MIRQFFYLLFFSSLLISCNNNSKLNGEHENEGANSNKLDTSITNSYIYQTEQEQLKRKRVLCKKLALYDIENATEDFELRIWLVPSMWDPSILYILKGKDTTWTLFHYQYYTRRATDLNQHYDSPNVDSVIMESVRPQKTSWKKYIDNLQLDSLWNLKTESEIKGKSFGVVDGHRYIIEFNNKGKYKYLFYTMPEYFQEKDNNHKRFIEFQKRLIDPIIYKGMRNP